MQSQRHVNSVSDLYVTDEVELLLDEIRELEPTSYCADDIQDFEIAGSVTGGPGGGRRSPAATEHSWDSHAHYKRVPPPRPARLAPLYCYARVLLTAAGLLRLILIIVCICCCSCLWAVVGLSTWRAPLPGRIRLLMLASLSSLLIHSLLMFLHITKLTQLFPFRWSHITLVTCIWSTVSLASGGGAVLHAVLASTEYQWAPDDVYSTLVAAASLGLSGAACACAASGVALRSPAPFPHPAPYRALALTRPP